MTRTIEELRRNGHFENENGEEIVLIQEAYPFNNICFQAYAIKSNDVHNPDQDGFIDAYRIRWEITNDEAEEVENMCNWTYPDEILQCGEYNIYRGIMA